MPAHNLLSRVPRHFVYTLTFDGVTYGVAGTITIGTVTGRILITHGSIYCSTTLTDATAASTLELGVAGNTAAIVAQTTGLDIDSGDYWRDATPEVLTAPAITDVNVASDIILTVASDTVTAGVLEFSFMWLPMSVDGNLA